MLADGVDYCPVCRRYASQYSSPSYVLSPGTVLKNRYLVGAMIGKGGFGITYIGYDIAFARRIAIKEFYPKVNADRDVTISDNVLTNVTGSSAATYSKQRYAFLEEARNLARFSDEPGIVSVKDFCEENETVYIIMEYIEGETLKQYLKRVGYVEYDNVYCLLMPVMESLRRLHSEGLLHRDISPENIMLSDSKIKLIDFGAAGIYADPQNISGILKHGYAPVEQYNFGKQGPWTDIYAMCATMYRAITGKLPSDSVDRMYSDDLLPPSKYGIPIDSGFERGLMHGLAIMPEDRIQSIDQLFSELNTPVPKKAGVLKRLLKRD